MEPFAWSNWQVLGLQDLEKKTKSVYPGANVIIHRLFTVIYRTPLSREEFTGKFIDIFFLML
jgi:hypothetical protein